MLRKPLIFVFVLMLAVSAAAQTPPSSPPPGPPLTPEQTALGRMGGDFARQLGERAVMPSLVDGGERGGGVLVFEHEAIDVNKLLPGVDTAEVERLKQLSANPQLLREAGDSALEHAQTRQDMAGEAFRAATGGQRVNSASFADAHAEIFALSADATAPATLAELFGDCRQDIEYTEAPAHTAGAYVIEERTCERVRFPPPCERTRSVSMDPRQSDPVGLFEQFTATVRREVRIADTGIDTSTLLQAAVNLEWQGNAFDVVIVQDPLPEHDWTAIVEFQHSSVRCPPATPDCQLFALAEVTFVVVGLDERIEGDCLMDSDGWCNAVWQCTDNAPRTIAGIQVGPTALPFMEALYPASPSHAPPSSLSPVCWRGVATYACDFHLGEHCISGPQGQVCHENRPDNTPVDSCPALANDPNCVRVRDTCAGDGTNPEGFCHVIASVYECRVPQAVPAGVARTRTSCDDRIGGMGEALQPAGGGLHESQLPSVSDIHTAHTLLSAVQHLLNDHTRSGLPDALDVRVFGGAARECRRTLGGAVNCCRTSQSSEGPRAFWEIYAEHNRLSHARVLVGGPDSARGAWSQYASGAASAELLDRPFASVADTVRADNPGSTGAAGAVSPHGEVPLSSVRESFLSRANAELKPSMNWLCSDEEFELAMERTVGNCRVVGTYCARSVLGMCLEKRESYCCFSTPMSRMFRDGLAETSGTNQPFGTAREPRCEGVSIDSINGNVLEHLNSTEWIGRMAQGGALPAQPQTLANFDFGRLTGNGSTLAGGQQRASTPERIAARFEAFDVRAARASIDTELSAALPPAVDRPGGPGTIALNPAFIFIPSARERVQVHVMRVGSGGPVSVTIETFDRSARAGLDYQELQQRVEWLDGEDGVRTVAVELRRNPNAAGVREIGLRLVAPTGGAQLHPSDTGTIRLAAQRSGALPPQSGACGDYTPPADGIYDPTRMTLASVFGPTAQWGHGALAQSRMFLPRQFAALSFEAPETPSQGEVVWRAPSDGPVGQWLVRISECPGDFRLREEAPGLHGCTTPWAPVSSGVIAAGHGAASACRLVPGRRYFLNVMLLDCPAGSCEWNAELRGPLPVPGGGSIPSPADCSGVQPPAWATLDPSRRSLGDIFGPSALWGVGGASAMYQRFETGQYVALEFVGTSAPPGQLAQVTWTAGYAETGMFTVSISRCPGDFRPPDHRSPGEQMCVLGPSPTGSITGGPSPAGWCPIVPQERYYMNVLHHSCPTDDGICEFFANLRSYH